MRIAVKERGGGWGGRLGSMKSRFFLPGIAPDLTRIAHAFKARFLYPLVHFILILKEPVAAKDIPPRKWRWGSFNAMLEYDGIGKVDDVVPVPGGGERIARFIDPLWARDPIAVTQELNRGRTKGCPMAGMRRVPVRASPWVTD